jgi:hypothetical protein
MAAPLIVINTYAIKAGQLEGFRHFLLQRFKILEAKEPRVLAVQAYVNEAGTEATVVQVYQDSASMERHEQMAHAHSEWAQRHFLDATTSIQVYGKPNDVVLEKTRQWAKSGVTVSVKPEHLGGFTRLVAAAG